MGYSTRRGGGDIIVVSGRALRSGMIEGLLVHEMSHIHRTDTNHPSHNRELLKRVEHSVIHRSHLTEDYQTAVVQQAINHVQDLYADDVAFHVLGQSGAFPVDRFFDFFLTWISDKPIDSEDAKTLWLNIGIMLNNCFVLSNTGRHNVPDVNDRAESKFQKSLSETSERMREEFPYLRDFMANLEEKRAEKEFEEDLARYLMRITELAE